MLRQITILPFITFVAILSGLNLHCQASSPTNTGLELLRSGTFRDKALNEEIDALTVLSRSPIDDLGIVVERYALATKQLEQLLGPNIHAIVLIDASCDSALGQAALRQLLADHRFTIDDASLLVEAFLSVARPPEPEQAKPGWISRSKAMVDIGYRIAGIAGITDMFDDSPTAMNHLLGEPLVWLKAVLSSGMKSTDQRHDRLVYTAILFRVQAHGQTGQLIMKGQERMEAVSDTGSMRAGTTEGK